MPRLIVVNRFDRERASLERSLESLREHVRPDGGADHHPDRQERDFRGVIDLVSMKGFTFKTDGSGAMTAGEIPGEQAAEAQAARDALVELDRGGRRCAHGAVLRGGDAHQRGGRPRGCAAAIAQSKLFPVLCASAMTNVGIQPLLDALVAYAPSPADRPFPAVRRDGSATIEVPASKSAPYSAFVWRTVADPFAGRITLFRVVSGSLRQDSTVNNVTRDTQERLGHLLVLQGKTHTAVPEIEAGDLGAVAKLKETQSGDTLADKQTPFAFPKLVFAEPVLSYAIEPKTRGDEEKISTALHRLREEDPTDPLQPRSADEGVAALGPGPAAHRGHRRQAEDGASASRSRSSSRAFRIARRSRMPADAHGRHKKQTGGHGQFGDCKIRVEPLARGKDFEFVDEIFGGSIPRQFVPAVEKGIQDARRRGYLAGYPMVDFRATVYDGSFHPVDSNELSFKMAGSLAYKDAMSKARPTILEPVMNVEVQGPSEYAGDLMGDLNSRRGRIAGMDTRGAMTIIRAQVPMSEMLTYEQHLTSATGGRGAYSMDYSHYEEVPVPPAVEDHRPGQGGAGWRRSGGDGITSDQLPNTSYQLPTSRRATN